MAVLNHDRAEARLNRAERVQIERGSGRRRLLCDRAIRRGDRNAAAEQEEHAAQNSDSVVRRKGIDLHSEIPPKLPPVRADADRAVQVLSNLLSNVLRYTPAPGKVQLSCERSTG